ncbi:ribosomal protein S18-alanine N-acetyltransferase [Defluviimonas sp. WL0002]|uniref:[Ribosomal protein bS18]-alanine N-acetyltransferase n=1 Tax=Albidovulum marisflavi TaxID=2984159 RepID=A0ABT2ZGG6_9RHOB|nr:ribosomal protein S18-alanine N-acetyltransferase [Defluviimonas sp. WL0002]MCV2870145.1 ribosomal protein S18-alanine N-acetyltransferase [Defluviimonas sp. WL0002]
MTPADLARLHAAAFSKPRPWSEAEFAEQIARADTFLISEDTGFVLGRVVLDEAELLTIAVRTDARRNGAGGRLVAAFLAEAARRGAATAFLEVAADNEAAIALYRSTGFGESGIRKGYYSCSAGGRTDALVMFRAIG